MENRIGNRLRPLKYGEFKCRYAYKYFNKVKDTWKPSDRPIRTYTHISNHIYIEGEEDDVWDDILDNLGNSDRKRIRLENKAVTEISDFGYSLANKDGSINIRESR